MVNRLIRVIQRFLSMIICFFYRFKKNSGEAIMFMPHLGFSKNDYIDLFNYRSDSAMTFAHYLISNQLCEDKEFICFVPSEDYIEESYKKAQELYPKKRFIFLPWDCYLFEYSKSNCLRKVIRFCKCVSKCSHIFVSITYRLEQFVSDQIIVDLNYYPAPLKNDFLPPSSKYYMKLEKVGKKYSMVMFTSEVAIRLEMPSMSLPHEKYSDFGLCRNDNLLNNDSFVSVRNNILSTLPYTANKIILYTPTHRDYEQDINDVSRSLFGYSFNFNELDSILRQEGIVIICKIHPKQNRAAFSTILPPSVIIHQANHDYGLTELMRVSDCMIADYSTGYFDYLLLDKPVIFNFYDIDRYKEERGFTYNPIESIVAGDIVKSQEEFIAALRNIDNNREMWKDKRAFVRDLFFTYQDSNCCKRVYNYFFGENN